MAFRRVLVFAVALSLLVPAVFLLQVVRYAHEKRLVPEVFLNVAPGASKGAIMNQLLEKGVLPWKLGNVVGQRIYGGSGGWKAGVYRFEGEVSLIRALADLDAGRIDLVSVTLPEGLNAREMGALLAKAQVTDGEAFVRLAYAPGSAVRFGVPGPTLEGYLFPDTYKFARRVPPEAVAEALTARFKKVWDEVAKESGHASDLKGLVTLASIIEKETGSGAERPLVGSVFANRLRLGMKLQSDPTVIYGIQNFDGNIRKADLLRDTPYNTYTRKGLPPGPIANPGRASLLAAAKPAASDYLYFVGKNNGTHAFSRTLAEHSAFVRRYQLGGR